MNLATKDGDIDIYAANIYLNIFQANIIIRRTIDDSLMCYACDTVVERIEDCAKHVKTRKHINRKVVYMTQYGDNMIAATGFQKIYCALCNKYIPHINVKKNHIQDETHKIMKMFSMECSFAYRLKRDVKLARLCKATERIRNSDCIKVILAENYNNFKATINIDKFDYNMMLTIFNNFYCILCKINDNLDNFDKHIGGQLHQDMMAKCCFIEGYGYNLIRMYNSKYLYCSLCLTFVPEREVHNHIILPEHIQNVQQINLLNERLRRRYRKIELNRMYTIKSKDDKINFDDPKANLMELNKDFLTIAVNKLYWHSICRDYSDWTCVACDEILPNNLQGHGLFDHIETISHLNNLQKCQFIKGYNMFYIRKYGNKIHCTVCNKSFKKLDDLSLHLLQSNHKNMLESSKITNVAENGDTVTNEPTFGNPDLSYNFIREVGVAFFECYVCREIFCYYLLKTHIASTNHYGRMKRSLILKCFGNHFLRIIDRTSYIFCYYCNDKLEHTNVYNHIKNPRHLKLRKAFIIRAKMVFNKMVCLKNIKKKNNVQTQIIEVERKHSDSLSLSSSISSDDEMDDAELPLMSNDQNVDDDDEYLFDVESCSKATTPVTANLSMETESNASFDSHDSADYVWCHICKIELVDIYYSLHIKDWVHKANMAVCREAFNRISREILREDSSFVNELLRSEYRETMYEYCAYCNIVTAKLYRQDHFNSPFHKEQVDAKNKFKELLKLFAIQSSDDYSSIHDVTAVDIVKLTQNFTQKLNIDDEEKLEFKKLTKDYALNSSLTKYRNFESFRVIKQQFLECSFCGDAFVDKEYLIKHLDCEHNLLTFIVEINGNTTEILLKNCIVVVPTDGWYGLNKADVDRARYCFLCQCNVLKINLKYHIESDQHKSQMLKCDNVNSNSIRVLSEIYANCLVCQELLEFSDIDAHIHSLGHVGTFTLHNNLVSQINYSRDNIISVANREKMDKSGDDTSIINDMRNYVDFDEYDNPNLIDERLTDYHKAEAATLTKLSSPERSPNVSSLDSSTLSPRKLVVDYSTPAMTITLVPNPDYRPPKSPPHFECMDFSYDPNRHLDKPGPSSMPEGAIICGICDCVIERGLREAHNASAPHVKKVEEVNLLQQAIEKINYDWSKDDKSK